MTGVYLGRGYLDITEQLIGRGRRRNRSVIFNPDAVGTYKPSGVSIGLVAPWRGLSANVLRRCVQKQCRGGTPIAMQPMALRLKIEGDEGFMPVT